jgi:hypothetical protein
MQPVNVAHIVKNTTNVNSMVLQHIYEALVGGPPLRWHEASADTLALNAYIRVLLDRTKSWFPDVYVEEA